MFIELTSIDKSGVGLLINKNKIELVAPDRWQEDSDEGTMHDGTRVFLDSSTQVVVREEYDIVRMKLLAE